MRIPKYEQSVRETGLPGVRIQPVKSALEGVLPVAGVAAGAYLTMRENASTLRAQEIQNQINAGDLEDFNKARDIQGSKAFGLADTFEKQRAERVAKIKSGVTDQATLDKIDRFAAQSAVPYKAKLMDHEHSEGVKFEENTINAGYQTDYSKATETANIADPVLRSTALKEMRNSVEARALSETIRRGLEGDAGAAFISERITPLHTGVIQSWLQQGKSAQAKDYFKENKDQISVKARGQIEKMINDDLRYQSAVDAVDKVWEKPELSFEDKTKALREQFKGDKDAIEDAIQELGKRHTQRQVSIAETKGKIWDMITGLSGQSPVGFNQIRKTKEWMDLDGTARAQFMEEWKAMQKRNSEGGESNRIQEMAMYLQYRDHPEQVMQMSDASIASLTGLIGKANTIQLMKDKRDFALDADKVRDGHASREIINGAISELGGIKPNPKPGTEDWNTLAKYRVTVDSEISNRQRREKRLLTDDEKREIAERAIRPLAYRKPGTLWDSTGQKPRFMFGSFMELDATPQEKTQALEILARNGATATVDNVDAMIKRIREGKK